MILTQITPHESSESRVAGDLFWFEPAGRSLLIVVGARGEHRKTGLKRRETGVVCEMGLPCFYSKGTQRPGKLGRW